MKTVSLRMEAPKFATASEALKSFSDESDAIALVYMPDRAVFARYERSRLTDEHGQEIDLDRAFEFRVFNEKTELRWRRRGERGEYILLEETTETDSRETFWRRETQYLLWGQRLGEENGWTILSSPQVGRMSVPFTAGKAAHLVLKAVEYFKTYEDGNVGFFAERLTGLAVADEMHCKDEKETENSDG